jgi:hypothetical protein
MMEVGFFRDAAISTRLEKWVFCRRCGFSPPSSGFFLPLVILFAQYWKS